jgi:hypothetical protein
VFLLLAIEVFGYFHQHANNFFSINVLTWHGQQKASKALLNQFCIPFIDKKMLVALQRTKGTSILRWAITIEEGSFRLGVLSSVLPFFLIDMIHAAGGRFNS